MTTERHAWLSTLDDGGERHVHLEVCRFGQDLDLCTRSHCPRCGASLAREPQHV
jgi:hypothetical protein